MEKINKSSKAIIADDVEETRTVVFKISDSSKDRHGSVVNMDNWQIENFNKNGIVGYQHEVHGGGMCTKSDPDDVIGVGKAWIEGEGDNKALYGSITFEPEDINPKAEKIFRKVLHGSLKATSVGFLPIQDSEGKTGQYGYRNTKGKLVDAETFYYHGQELLEFSIVNIPSNANALKRNRDVAANALQYLKRETGASYGELEAMTVRQVIDLLEGKKEITSEEVVNHSREGSLAVYRRRVKLLKLNKWRV